jgi:hypothetical protein
VAGAVVAPFGVAVGVAFALDFGVAVGPDVASETRLAASDPVCCGAAFRLAPTGISTRLRAIASTPALRVRSRARGAAPVTTATMPKTNPASPRSATDAQKIPMADVMTTARITTAAISQRVRVGVRVGVRPSDSGNPGLGLGARLTRKPTARSGKHGMPERGSWVSSIGLRARSLHKIAARLICHTAHVGVSVGTRIGKQKDEKAFGVSRHAARGGPGRAARLRTAHHDQRARGHRLVDADGVHHPIPGTGPVVDAVGPAQRRPLRLDRTRATARHRQTGTRRYRNWAALAIRQLRRRQRLPVPAPFYLCTAVLRLPLDDPLPGRAV